MNNNSHAAEPQLKGTITRRVSGEIQVIARTGQLLRRFAQSPRPIKATDVAADLGLGRATAHRYLSSLAAAGFLQREEDGYVLGPLLITLGVQARTGLGVLEIADRHVQQLSTEIGETVVVGVWGGLGAVVASSHEPEHRFMRISVRVGTTLPLSAAQTIVFLAFLEDRVLVDQLLQRVDELTQSDLRSQIELVRRSGFIINETVTQGVRVLAAPVFDGSARICATLAIVGTVQTVPDDVGCGHMLGLLSTAERLSRELGYLDELPFRVHRVGGSIKAPEMTS